MTPTGNIYLRGQDAAGAYVFGDTDTGLVFTPGAYYRLRVLVQGVRTVNLSTTSAYTKFDALHAVATDGSTTAH